MDDIIEIGDLDTPTELPSANFGAGIELLMNEKRQTSDKKDGDDIDIQDLDNLESELNAFSDIKINIADTSKPDFDDNSRGISLGESNSVKFNFDKVEVQPSIVTDTKENMKNDNQTWDGYSKFNDIPLNPSVDHSSSRHQSKEEALKEKFNLLKKLEVLERKGVELTKKYSMESNFQEMKGEYETIMAEKEKENSVKFQGNMLSAMINGIEFLNGRFDPFDIKLDGWGEQFQENITDYDEIFGELHEKYKSSAKMAPEIKLLFQLGAGAMMVHMTNTMFKSAMPGMDDIMRQNPELAHQFTKAAVDSMAPQNPGFSGFMNNIMREEPTVVNTGPPPAPIETQGPRSIPPPRRPGYVEQSPFANRPDLQATKGVSLGDNFASAKQTPVKSKRREMKGPDDIGDILGGLKTKTISMQDKNEVVEEDKGSTISITELKELQKDSVTATPKKSKRRNTSNKNIISLDI
tara:strand:+ start:402 stop:1796 length:1395 start_codon:yes stop_codon:yes gene_type:complete